MDAIVLKATSYEDDGKILKLFSKCSGVVSVIIKQLTRKGAYFQTLTSPLARGEFHLYRRQSELYSLRDASLIDGHYEVRNNLDRLDCAGSILRSILISQCPEKASPELYKLTVLYLKKLKSFPDPAVLALSFKMKLLNFEGLFPETKEDFNNSLSSYEWLILECLCHAKKFELLQSVTLSTPLIEKAECLFNNRITEFN
jgi:DNA repair protein RecO